MIAKNDISQLTKVSEGVRQELAAELRAADFNWKQAYGEYQSGGWYVAPMRNAAAWPHAIRTEVLGFNGARLQARAARPYSSGSVYA